ncbi:MAG: hypothetical protein OXT64_14220 [Gammaproteobacteria bacterium]|nr:hypothetical protein [Gammaproteobacteria bacterium]MDE0441396.1 hypothetical protein [Gammaproteobacteria bacterium]
MSAKGWEIVGYNGTKETYRETVHAGFGHRQIEEILRRLASRDLTPQEVVEDSVKQDLGRLHVNNQGDTMLMTVGNPYYVAQFHG